ncbi:MAG: hypothetical protein AB7F86_07990 [Bdellovibrionales bacterium]
MVLPRAVSLKPILASKGGVHLTAYLSNDGRPQDLGVQIIAAIEAAEDLVLPVLSPENTKKFLEPLVSLASDRNFLKRMNGNLALFRTLDSFRIINLPVEVNPICVVANSFHVKPLLKWLQVDREFLLLGIEPRMASLHHGTMSGIRHVDSVVLPEHLTPTGHHSTYSELKDSRLISARVKETMIWLNEWLQGLTKNAKVFTPKLFVAGDARLTQALLGNLDYKDVHASPIYGQFRQALIPVICAEIRSHLRSDAKLQYERVIREFHLAEEERMAKKNLFEIGKAAATGQIKKLIVADGLSIFGKVDPSGGVVIHPGHLDHEDDDVLDDLAQMVMEKGGEVMVADRSEIPKGRPALAILKGSRRSPRARPEIKESKLLVQLG